MYDKEASNKDLKELCEAVGANIVAKNPSKPNKTELTSALDGYYGISAEPEAEAIDEGVEIQPNASKQLTRSQKRKVQYNEGMKLIRVLVTSNDVNQTKTELITVGWGNNLLGYHNDRIILGKPWHVRNGALNNLRDRMIKTPIQNEERNRIDYVTVPAYNIVDLGLLTMKEYREMGEKQKAKEASLAIL